MFLAGADATNLVQGGRAPKVFLHHVHLVQASRSFYLEASKRAQFSPARTLEARSVGTPMKYQCL